MIGWRNARHAVLLLIILALAMWAADQGMRAAANGAATKVAPASGAVTAKTTPATPAPKAKATAPAPAPAPQGKGQGQGQLKAKGPQVVGPTGQTGQMRSTTQAQRKAARVNQGRQTKGTAATFVGVKASNAAISPLAAVGTPGGPITLAAMTPGAVPDYFGVPNWANSPLPTFSFTAVGPPPPPVPVAVGNPVIARTWATDNAYAVGTLGPILVVVPIPLPAGLLQSFQAFNQVNQVPGSPGNVFHAYVLRPTGTANQYMVVFDSGLLTVPATGVGTIQTYSVGSVPVLAGDIVAFYGEGIPWDQTGTDILSYPAYAAPVQSTTITVAAGDPNFPVYPQARIYSFGAVVLTQAAAPSSTSITGGMRKFIDPLPALHIAVPDVSKFPGSDYYEISLEQYHQIMHTDLATANGGLGTTLRGYRQTNGTAPQASPSYLGPVILATKNRPVRIKFTNNLPTGSGGNLFIPTDTTYMGAGMGPDGTAYTENRATLHLHGGNTPWISDGTPHQWTAPKNEVTNFKKGVSTAYVPDMWFDAAGVLLGSCQGQRTCAVAGATNNPGDGSMTFYYTNQQSGRLMFYHDHAYGITRLNVYAGEAAGYLIADPIEENALAAATVPGTVGTTPDLGHMIPLVIQDKTFVPDNGTTAGSQLAATDPTWNISTWGGFGNLWFPHVYMPNQNPIDPSGANPYGRWDYGPWFWPVQDPSTLIGLPFPCGPTFNLVCPGTPSISGTPEAFMDTPVVNGKAYPTLTVDPAAYRFHILSAGNDRTFNLGFYVADNLAVAVTNPGSGYSATTPPAVTFTSSNGVTGTGTGTAVVSTGVVTDITLTAPGSGFVTAPAVAIAAPGCVINTTTCIQATAIADISAAAGSTGGPIINIFITNGGAGYTSVPTITITPNVPGCGGAGPACAAATAVLTPAGELLGITVTGATGWTAAPTVTIGAPAAGGVQADALASVNTEVKMIPAAPPAAGALLQPCPTFTPITNVGLGMGLATTHIYNGTTNITGLPPNCLPIYSKDPGLPGPVGWPTDGRTGGVPDPTTAGPPIIQIGTEGGLLPKAVVIPSTPTSYEYNRRSITVLNIGVHGLLLGPAERADVVVDFTPWAGKTLILYNDAPTPVPAFDPRTDYYTGDPDQTATGGAPSTLPGFGPNIRTIMQIKVAATSSVVGSHSLNLPALQAALPGIYTGTLAVPNQPAPIVNPGVVVHIGDTTLINAAGPVINVNMTAGGNSYTTPPTLTFVPAGARGTGILGTGPLASIRILNGGAGYTSTPTVTIAVPAGCVINGTTCVRATATATRTGGAITLITLTNPGSGYSSAPAVTVSGGGRPTRAASLQAVWAGAPLTGVTITAGGNYGAVPLVFFSGGGGNGAQGTAVLANSFPLLPKAIQELFTLDYGRMNATLGVELPFTNFVTQTTIPYGYIDPPTEMFKDGETQLWKITHNGVDTHFMHFHLFNVQVINRVGWDGAVKPPDENELGWKDTVRMNPLEDVVVALRAMKQVVVNPTDLDVSNLPNSVRPLDVTQPLGTSAQFTGIDPNNQPAVVENDLTNFGWEYVWHCHILGHEENDMMRAMIMVVAPAAPGIPTVTQPGTSLFGPVVLSWTNSAANATGFLIERATVTGGITGAYASIGSVSNLTTFSDTTAARLTTYKYRVTAVNVAGYIGIGYPTQTAASLPTVQTGMITTR